MTALGNHRPLVVFARRAERRSRTPILIPERFGIFPEFLKKNSGIPEGYQLDPVASKSSMEVAEPLPRVYLDIIQEMVAIPHHLTPCCTIVAPFLRWGPRLMCTIVLFILPKANLLRRWPHTL